MGFGYKMKTAPPAAPDQNGNFMFAADNTHFDEVNAYYHVNKIHDYFKNLGFSALDKPLPVVVHYGDSFDNAFFSPEEGKLYFGDGNVS